jgi:hypothetical protein
MHRRFLIALVFCLLAGNTRASPLSLTGPSLIGRSMTAPSPGEQCRAAISAAERGHGIPSQLLAAIGRIESGKRDPISGVRGAWPWTINAEGQGYYFDSKAEAIQAVEALRARGVRSIDVGCMQVNLMYHPAAFATLDIAFEPAVNADYAARFLVQLHEQTGDWTTATAHYHSADPNEGGPYADKVTSVWPEEQRKAGFAPPGAGVPGIGASGPGGSFSPGQFGQVSRSPPPFPAHQPARLFAMAGAPPMMMPPGASPIGTMGSGQPVAAPGRSLDFYRSAPIRTDTPMRPIMRLPLGGALR